MHVNKCSYCGCVAEVEFGIYTRFPSEEIIYGAQVVCLNCEMAGPKIKKEIKMSAIQKAKLAWNLLTENQKRGNL